MIILVEDSRPDVGVYEMEVPDDYLAPPKVEAKPTIEERITALEDENALLKSQLEKIDATVKTTEVTK